MKQKGKRVLAIILSFIIILGCINGTGIQASETDNDNTADEDVSVDAGDEYSIAIGKMEHGTITAINDTEVSGSALVVTTAESGSAVKVNIMPDNEYRLKEMKVSYKTEAPDEKNEEIKAEKSKDDDFVYIFTMPAADVTIDAEFIKYDEESDLVSGKDNYIVIDGTSGIMGSGEANQKAEIYNLFNGSEYALEEKQLKFLNESDQNPDTAERVANTTAWEFAGKEGSVEFETRSPIVPCGYQLEMPSGYYETKDNTKCPDSWVLKARLNKNEEWTEISRITNDKLLEYRDKDDYLRNYPCDNDNNKVYRYFRLEISGNKGGDNTILEELRMWDKKVPSYSITSVISTDDIQFLEDESVKLTTKVVALDGTERK